MNGSMTKKKWEKKKNKTKENTAWGSDGNAKVTWRNKKTIEKVRERWQEKRRKEKDYDEKEHGEWGSSGNDMQQENNMMQQESEENRKKKLKKHTTVTAITNK